VTQRHERVRPVGAFDVALLAELHTAIFTAPWDRPWSAESLAQILAMPGACGWLLEAGELPVGFVLACFTLDEGEILLTGILPAAREQGHGARLMQTAIAAAREAGIARLFLEHAEPNVAAARLYQRLGFVPIGRRLQYYSSHRPAPGHHDAGRHDAVTRMLDLSAAEPVPTGRVDTQGSK
jgi:[ribosomal protein S18]-alanine N-acetyltransferase